VGAAFEHDYDLILDVDPSEPGLTNRFPDLHVSVVVPSEVQEHSADITARIAELVRDYLRDAIAARVGAAAYEAEPAMSHLSYHDEATNLQFTFQGLSLLSRSSVQTGQFLGNLPEQVHKIFGAYGINLRVLTGVTCICMVGGGLPGKSYDLEPVAALFANPPRSNRNAYTIAVYFSEDVLRMEIPSNITLPGNLTEIVLKSEVGWAKEISGFTWCKLSTVSIKHPGSNRWLEARMALRQARCYAGEADTIIFRKPKFFGFWHDMYHWAPKFFWRVHGGRQVIYTWLVD